MTVEIFYFEGCPNHKPASELVRRVILDEGIAADVNEIEVPDRAAVETAGFLGSPTIRVNGIDVEPAARNTKESCLACRCYPGGLPPAEMIRAALREARGQTQ